MEMSRLIEAADRRAEIHAVARTIRELMLSGKRYKDHCNIVSTAGKV